MNKTYQTLFVCVTLVFNFASKGFGQETVSFSFDQDQWNEHLGIIAVASTGQRIGSGFVFGSHNDVITCAHVLGGAEIVLHETNLLYFPQDGVRQLKLKYILPKYDLAVFSPNPEIKGTSKKCGDFKKIRPGDQIVYVGYDTRLSNATNSTQVINSATVTAV